MHERLASQAFVEGAPYPTASNIYDGYILAPVLINFLELQLWAFGTTAYNCWINIALNLLIFWEIYLIANAYFGRRTAYFAVILYCLLYSTWTSSFPASTEVGFLALSLSAVALAVGQTKRSCRSGIATMFAAGILLALANSIRPLAVIFIPTIICILISQHVRWQRYVACTVGYVVVFVAIGSYVKSTTGYFHASSTTGGLNMLLTANDNSNGMLPPNYDLAEMGIESEEGLDYDQKDRQRTEQALSWIMDHKARWIALYFKKIGILYWHDVAFDGYYKPNVGMMEMSNDRGTMVRTLAERALKSLVYYAVMVMFVVSVWRHRRQLWSAEGALLLIPLLGTLGTCVFQTMPRYHYPFLPIIVIWAAALIKGKRMSEPICRRHERP